MERQPGKPASSTKARPEALPRDISIRLDELRPPDEGEPTLPGRGLIFICALLGCTAGAGYLGWSFNPGKATPTSERLLLDEPRMRISLLNPGSEAQNVKMTVTLETPGLSAAGQNAPLATAAKLNMGAEPDNLAACYGRMQEELARHANAGKIIAAQSPRLTNVSLIAEAPARPAEIFAKNPPIAAAKDAKPQPLPLVGEAARPKAETVAAEKKVVASADPTAPKIERIVSESKPRPLPAATEPAPAPKAPRAAQHFPEAGEEACSPGALAASSRTGARPMTENNSYAVQISARRDPTEAQASFEALQERFPETFANRRPLVTRVDLGGRGVHYRTLVAAFENFDFADNFCSHLKACGGECVVRRNGSPGAQAGTRPAAAAKTARGNGDRFSAKAVQDALGKHDAKNDQTRTVLMERLEGLD